MDSEFSPSDPFHLLDMTKHRVSARLLVAPHNLTLLHTNDFTALLRRCKIKPAGHTLLKMDEIISDAINLASPSTHPTLLRT